jgi:hypothetical protein
MTLSRDALVRDALGESVMTDITDTTGDIRVSRVNGDGRDGPPSLLD